MVKRTCYSIKKSLTVRMINYSIQLEFAGFLNDVGARQCFMNLPLPKNGTGGAGWPGRIPVGSKASDWPRAKMPTSLTRDQERIERGDHSENRSRRRDGSISVPLAVCRNSGFIFVWASGANVWSLCGSTREELFAVRNPFHLGLHQAITMA